MLRVVELLATVVVAGDGAPGGVLGLVWVICVGIAAMKNIVGDWSERSAGLGRTGIDELLLRVDLLRDTGRLCVTEVLATVGVAGAGTPGGVVGLT